MKMPFLLTLLVSLLLFAPIFSQKCINTWCDGVEKADATCSLKYRRTTDWGNTYKCMEELLNQKYSGCLSSKTARFESAAEGIKGSFKLTGLPFETKSYVCTDFNCYTTFLRLTDSSLYCPAKRDYSCSLQRKVTRDYGNSYICLEDFLNSKNYCPGKWWQCESQGCRQDSVAYTMDYMDYDPQMYYCDGQGCPNSILKKTSSGFTCKDSSCEYTDGYPYSNYPLKWTLDSNNKWKCQDEEYSSCGNIIFTSGKYVCAPKSNDCLNSYLVEDSKCDRSQFDCTEEYPGWFCQRPSSWKMIAPFFALIIIIILLGIIYLWNHSRKKQLKQELAGGYSNHNVSQAPF